MYGATGTMGKSSYVRPRARARWLWCRDLWKCQCGGDGGGDGGVTYSGEAL